MEKIRIIVKRKDSALPVMPVSPKLPALPTLSTLSPDHGESIPFIEICRPGIKERTWNNYTNTVTSFYKMLELPDKDIFYWEYLSKDETIQKIIENAFMTYHIRDGKALACKLSPFRSLLYRVSEHVSRDSIAAWGEVIIDCRNNFIELREKYRGKKHEPETKPQLAETWEHVKEQLHNVSHKKGLDPRIRVLATVYKYGYIMKVPIMFRTYISNNHNENREHYET